MAQVGYATPPERKPGKTKAKQIPRLPQTPASQSTKKARTETKVSTPVCALACHVYLWKSMDRWWLLWVADYSRGFVFFWNVSGEYYWVVWSYITFKILQLRSSLYRYLCTK